VTLVQPDNNPANDRASTPVTVVAFRDVAVNITAVPDSINVGGSFNYTINM
jgi:hypothetical protein